MASEVAGLDRFDAGGGIDRQGKQIACQGHPRERARFGDARSTGYDRYVSVKIYRQLDWQDAAPTVFFAL